MRLSKHICLISTGLFLAGCATQPKPFDTPPARFASAAELAKRDAAKALKCNTDGAEPTFRSPGLFPFDAVDRSGRVAFIFDLDDAGKPIHLRITNATEEVFVQPTRKAVATWEYAAKVPGEVVSKRENICSSLNFALQDDRGRRIPTWTDIELKNRTYQKYKASQTK